LTRELANLCLPHVGITKTEKNRTKTQNRWANKSGERSRALRSVRHQWLSLQRLHYLNIKSNRYPNTKTNSLFLLLAIFKFPELQYVPFLTTFKQVSRLNPSAVVCSPFSNDPCMSTRITGLKTIKTAEYGCIRLQAKVRQRGGWAVASDKRWRCLWCTASLRQHTRCCTSEPYHIILLLSTSVRIL